MPSETLCFRNVTYDLFEKNLVFEFYGKSDTYSLHEEGMKGKYPAEQNQSY